MLSIIQFCPTVKGRFVAIGFVSCTSNKILCLQLRMHGTCIRMRNKRNLFTCQSAVNYRLNLCKANKVKKRAVLALTLHKECDIVVLYRINRYSSAWFVCALQKKKNVREQRRWIVTVWRARPTLHSTSRKRVSAFGMFAVSRVVFFYCLFQPEEEKQCNIPSKSQSTTTFCAWWSPRDGTRTPKIIVLRDYVVLRIAV